MINGITLVALIITIIILIILAAVSIGAIVNNNFIGLATKATENYAEAQKYEDKVMENYVDLLKAVVANISSVGGGTSGQGDGKPGNPDEGRILYKKQHKRWRRREQYEPNNSKRI